ncbi:hypothetical protein [Pseudonocardia sp. WMMC193]|uniref:hypothetical protein n=1 Tax=Pseudonocardia sp. WMMC193 TaxID=2911965 RepID=UPI001F1FBD2D|nr:hypothetical protein [Pseudonocardia sp. WMMC193]MCF7548346.1 hypothetical protein [Pseudonocardia sp. WMMC193]
MSRCEDLSLVVLTDHDGGSPPDLGIGTAGSTLLLPAAELGDGAGLSASVVEREGILAYVAAEGAEADVAARSLATVLPGPVVTRGAARAVGLCLGALMHLRSVQRDPRFSRTLVVGARGAGALVPLLLACGVADLSLWNVEDDRWLPLRTAVRDVDVVIDLVGRVRAAGVDQDCAVGSVIEADRFDPDVALAPALLAGLADARTSLRGEPPARLLRDVVDAVLTAGVGRDWSAALHDQRTAEIVRRAVRQGLGGA